MSRGIKGIIRKLSLLLVVIMVAAGLFAAPGINAARAAGSSAASAVQFLQNDYTANGLNNADGGVGSYALYVLNQAGVDVSAWKYNGTSLEDAVVSAINVDLLNSGASAKLLVQDLAAAKSLGRDSLSAQLAQVLQGRQSNTGFDSNSYSDIPAYDLLGRAGAISEINADFGKGCILAAQNTTVGDAAYGSFGGEYDGIFYPDFMTTAEAVRALNYLDTAKSDAQVQTAINNGLDWIQKQQQDDGSFTGSAWDDPVVDTSEVIITLDVLGMDLAGWESSAGNTAVDYMMNEALNDDGSFGTSKNVMDATWALCAYNMMDAQFYLDPSSVDLKVGGTAQLSASWQNNEGTTDVTQAAQWTAADSSIASVDSSGLVTALKEGETEVYAVYGGLTATAAVTVSSSTNGGGGDGSEVMVSLAVVGSNKVLLYGPSTVSVNETNKWGLTALGALDASGISYTTSSWSYGDLVNSIKGLANSGLSGWMYTVNGSNPGVGADKYKIKNKNKIIFYYSESMDQKPPQWDELEGFSAGGGGVVAASDDLPDPVTDTDLKAALRNAGSAGQVALQAADDETSLALSSDQITEVLSKDKPLAVTIQGVQIILSPESLEVPELKDEDAAFLQFKVEKLSSEDVQSLANPSAVMLKLAGDVYELTIQVVNEEGTLQEIEEFPTCTVLLPVPAGLEDAAAAGSLMAYLYNEDSEAWEKAGGTYDAAGAAIGFNVSHFSKYALLETVPQPVEKVAFNDIVGHWAQEEIEYMAAKGYVAGVGSSEFAPDAGITRAEFSAILARMAGLMDDAAAAARFSDVPAGAWYQGTVGAATTAGLVYGTSENSFMPGEPVTREQMAAMIVRFMSKNSADMAVGDTGAAELLAGFSDSADISPWACSPVALAVREGLMAGRESGMFVPRGSATRAEATVVLYRVMQKETIE